MRVLIVFNEWFSDLGKFDISTPEKLSIPLELHKNITEVIVCTGPAHYTTFRKGIAIGLALQTCVKCDLFGFSMIDHYLRIFGKRCFYKQKNLVWINDNNQERGMYNINNTNITSDFVGNKNINESNVIDCSIENIWKYCDQLKHSVDQVYYDRFAW
jgi:hypothetical protein